MLVIRRIHVVLKLRAEEAQRATVDRVHGFFAGKCPVYLTLKNAIDITTEWQLEEWQSPEPPSVGSKY